MLAKHNYDNGFLLLENHEFEEAIVQLKIAINIDSTGNCATGKNGMAYSELGYAYTRLGDFEKAIPILNKTIKINNKIPEPYLSKSVIQMQQGNNELAIETLDTLIRYCPNFSMAYAQRCFINNYIGNKECIRRF